MTTNIRTIEAANKRAEELDRDESVIPAGLYCYVPKSGWKIREDGTPYFETEICPYWASNPDKDEQESGYCAFLQRGDWESEGFPLLWDQCKECGIKDDIDDIAAREEADAEFFADA